MPGAVIETATWGYESPVCVQQPGHHSYLKVYPQTRDLEGTNARACLLSRLEPHIWWLDPMSRTFCTELLTSRATKCTMTPNADV